LCNSLGEPAEDLAPAALVTGAKLVGSGADMLEARLFDAQASRRRPA
jgi:hypothetical protein